MLGYLRQSLESYGIQMLTNQIMEDTSKDCERKREGEAMKEGRGSQTDLVLIEMSSDYIPIG